MIYHILAFVCGFIIDLIVGDPYCLPHPIRGIGKLISINEKRHLSKENLTRHDKLILGRKLVFNVCFTTVILATVILGVSYWISDALGVIVESIMTYQILATKSLRVESMKVYRALADEGIDKARQAVSMIVGRDTEELTSQQVAKAAVETVAENTSDGIIAPMLYLAIGGPVLGFLYKSINTMDSMVGYKNEKYLDYGRTAAKLDDYANYIPARISAHLMIASCALLGKQFCVKDAIRIHKRDCDKVSSPNAGQTESVCAGALGIMLAGDAKYFGKVVKKPFIGDEKRSIEIDDIIRANTLLYATASCCEAICVIVLFIVAMITKF